MKIVLLVMFVLISQSKALPSSSNDELFENLRSTLDYNNSQIKNKIPQVESKLINIADKNTRKLSEGAYHNSSDLALTLVYAGLFMANTNDAVSNGFIDYKLLTSYRRFSRIQNLKKELIARKKRIVRYIEIAQIYRSSDQRISSWLAGAKASLEKEENGVLSIKAIDALLKAATDYPAFNLFTAILALRNEKLTDSQKLQVLTLTEQMVGPQNPCRTSGGADHVCLNGWKAPFNFQTAVALLGDVLIKQAELDILNNNSSNIQDGYRLAYTAKGVYSSAFSETMKNTTAVWENRNALQERIVKTDLLIQSKNGFGTFWQSQSGVRTYQCASCHSGNGPISKIKALPAY
jgi:hypothetical protein